MRRRSYYEHGVDPERNDAHHPGCPIAYPWPVQPSLALIEGKDDLTHFSGPPRRWGGPEWSAKTTVCRGCESAFPQPIQPSLTLTEVEDD